MVIDRHYPIITVYVIFVSKNLSFYERIRCFDILMWCLRILNQIAYISLFPFLTHGGRETLICVRKLNPDWFKWWLGAFFGAEPVPELVLIWWRLDHSGWILVKSKWSSFLWRFFISTPGRWLGEAMACVLQWTGSDLFWVMNCPPFDVKTFSKLGFSELLLVAEFSKPRENRYVYVYIYMCVFIYVCVYVCMYMYVLPLKKIHQNAKFGVSVSGSSLSMLTMYADPFIL